MEVINQPAEASGTLSTYLGGGKDELGALLTIGVIGVKSDVGEEMPFRGIGKALRQHFYFFVWTRLNTNKTTSFNSTNVKLFKYFDL